jgi:DNA replication protein DnaC
LKTVKEYLEYLEDHLKNGRGLFFMGPNGVGKSFLTVEILKECIRSKITTQFASLGGLVEMFTAGWHSELQKRNFQRRIRNVKMLAIDDIEKEYRGGSGLSEIVFDNLIRYRVQRKKTTPPKLALISALPQFAFIYISFIFYLLLLS